MIELPAPFVPDGNVWVREFVPEAGGNTVTSTDQAQLELDLAVEFCPVPRPAPAWTSYPSNDTGYAQLFVDRMQGTLRYVPPWRKWIGFESGWTIDRTGNAIQAAVRLSQDLLRDAAELVGEYERKDAVKRALDYGNHYRIEQMLKIAQVDPRVVVQPDQLDVDPWVAGAPNGLIDLQTGRLIPHDLNRLVTKRVGCLYDPTARAPRWSRFMLEIMGGDEVMVRFLQKAAGYSLTGDTSEQVFFFLYGGGSNGKSVMIEALQRVFGEYGCTTAPEVVAQGKHDTPMHFLAKLPGVRHVTLPETEENQRIAESRVKALVGGDRHTACAKYQSPFEFDPVLKLWIHGNHKPNIKGQDDGIWRRVRLVPFTQRFEGPNADPNLGAVLAAEAPGILNWLVEGCLMWREERLGAPQLVLNAVQNYRAEEDILGQFLTDRVVVDPTGHVAGAQLHRSYLDWAADQNIQYTYSKIRFGKKIRERYPMVREGVREGIGGWVGLSFSPNLAP